MKVAHMVQAAAPGPPPYTPHQGDTLTPNRGDVPYGGALDVHLAAAPSGLLGEAMVARPLVTLHGRCRTELTPPRGHDVNIQEMDAHD